MTNHAPIVPRESKRLSDCYLAFRLNRWFVTDNRNLFLVPSQGFCTYCFKYRYLSELDCVQTTEPAMEALSLAQVIEQQFRPGPNWHWFSVQERRHVREFRLIPFEHCARCMPGKPASRHASKNRYAAALRSPREFNIRKLGDLLFSFGFARGLYTGRRLGFPDNRFDRVLGDNYFSRISSRIASREGVLADVSCIGYSRDRDLAELKAMMEYAERYAFIQQVSPMQASEHDDGIINEYLARYTGGVSASELEVLKKDSIWAIDLSAGTVHPVPARYIYDKGDIRYIRPTSSGFAAHTRFGNSLVNSILELVERDAFVRFWHDPLRAYSFNPGAAAERELDDLAGLLAALIGNNRLTANCFVVKSPLMLPVVMTTISSDRHDRPPSLVFGYGAGVGLEQALQGALNELRTNTSNLIYMLNHDAGYLDRSTWGRIESIPDRMNYYSTCRPRSRLYFLDMQNPLQGAVYQEAANDTLDEVVRRFEDKNLKIYGIDCSPACFMDLGVYVTRAFSPMLYPLQYQEERSLSLQYRDLSPGGEQPHFFI